MSAITLFDGGVGQEVSKRSSRPADELWCINAMLDDPGLIANIHQEYLDAGCQVITLNTYTATPARLDTFLGTRTTIEDVYQTAIAAAQSVKGKRTSQIAGCLPPLVASYYTDVCLDMATSIAHYTQLIGLQESGVDVFLVETMSSVAEAQTAMQALQTTNKPWVISFCLQDNLHQVLRSGESLQSALQATLNFTPAGIMLNCSIPEAITHALPTVAEFCSLNQIRFGAYANGFTSIDKLTPGSTVNVLEARLDLSPSDYANICRHWANIGATLIGGCCEITPAHMQAVWQQLDQTFEFTPL